MSNAVFAGNNQLITVIVTLTQRGMTDHQIGQLLSRHYKTIAYHRSKNGIASGRSHKAALTAQRRAQTVHKRTYKMTYNYAVLKEQLPKTKIKHGLNAYAPVVCKGSGRPYRKTCNIPDSDLAVGEPCITEATIIATLSEQYYRENK